MAHFGVVAPAFLSHFNTLAALAGRAGRSAATASPSSTGRMRAPSCATRASAFTRSARTPIRPARWPPRCACAANPGGPLGLRRVIRDMARATDMLCETLPGASRRCGIDALIADQMEAAGGLVAEALGLPFVSVACALPVNREPGIPLPVMPFGYGDRRTVAARWSRAAPASTTG